MKNTATSDTDRNHATYSRITAPWSVPTLIQSRIASLLGRKSYTVLTTPTDPFVRPARARLIWASNTAQATQRLGLRAALAASVDGVPVKFESANGVPAVRRALDYLYNVDADFDLIGLFDVPSKYGPLGPGEWALNYDLPRAVYPHTGILHTRDPKVASRATSSGLTVVYEDHDEDHNKNFKKLPELQKSAGDKLRIVAIANGVRERLVSQKIPKNKILVLDSGFNSKSLSRNIKQIETTRSGLLARGFKSIVAYTGGLQIERGVEHIVLAAEALPDTLFILLGGTEADQLFVGQSAIGKGLSNVVVAGYMPQADANLIQQSADVVLATRKHDERAAITSPLKFFEYLASGTPVVAANIPAVARLASSPGCAIATYDPRDPATLVDAVRMTQSKFPWMADGYELNRKLSLDYSWEARQIKVLEYIANPNQAIKAQEDQ